VKNESVFSHNILGILFIYSRVEKIYVCSNEGVYFSGSLLIWKLFSLLNKVFNFKAEKLTEVN
jgi:hypothetical protein